MTQSHWSLRDDYEVTGRALDSLVNGAISHPVCAGARMTGAGFGGCAIALVEASGYKSFIDHVSKKYHKETGLQAHFYPMETYRSGGIIPMEELQ
jgi:galactokinase